MNNDILKSQNGDILTVDNNGNTTSLSDAVGIVAMSLYEGYREFRRMEDGAEKTAKETELGYMTTILNSLSNALSAIRGRLP